MFRIDYLICFTFFTLIYLFEINSFFLFSGNWKPFQCSQGCTTFETRTGSSQIGSILRIRSRHANPVTLLLYARSSLVGLYMVRNSSNLHVWRFFFLKKWKFPNFWNYASFSQFFVLYILLPNVKSFFFYVSLWDRKSKVPS